jgi:pimeloyl-ACP methyl ester carboxylesterase
MTIVAWARARADEVPRRVSAAALLNTGVGDLIDEARVLPAPTPLAAVHRAASRLILGAPAPLPRTPSPVSHRVVRHVALQRSATPGQVAFCENMVLECRRDVRAGCGGALSGLDLNDAVESVHVPTVVLAGCEDRLTPPSHARRLGERLPRLERMELIPDAGHMCPVTHPDLVTDALRRLVADHGTAPGVEGRMSGRGWRTAGAERRDTVPAEPLA